MFARLKIGLAFRYSRNIVGGLSGFLFSLGTIFKVPLKGKGPAIFIGSLGLSLFFLKVRDNYQIEDSDISIDDYKKNKIQSSTVIITTELMKNAQKLRIFQEGREKIINPERKQGETVVPFAPNQLEEILSSMLNEHFEHNKKWGHVAHKYVHCTAAFLAQVGSHFMECLLVKAYEDSELFHLNKLSIDTLLIIMLAILSLYNGYHCFQENHTEYEKTSSDELCDRFIKQLAH